MSRTKHLLFTRFLAIELAVEDRNSSLSRAPVYVGMFSKNGDLKTNSSDYLLVVECFGKAVQST